MKFSALSVVLAVAAAANPSSFLTKTITNNGMTYTKTDIPYTGQPTTEPTEGTFTHTNTIKKSDITYTKTITNTYGMATTFNTVQTILGPHATYEKSVTKVLHKSELSSIRATETGEAKEEESKSSSSKSSSGDANGLRVGAGAGGVAIFAAALLM